MEERAKKYISVGLLAHVDAGKTTLSEALLYEAGQLKKAGRVDHGDAYLDTDALERERGITIFSKQAVLPLGELTVTLMDTPGHVDFSTEMERTLGVMDYAVLVISGSDGVQGHTRTLWELLERHRIPTVLFINKMDLPTVSREALLGELRDTLSPACVDFTAGDREQLMEDVSVLDETLMEMYLESGVLSEESIGDLFQRRGLFPCCFGSALKMEGVDRLLELLKRYAAAPAYGKTFGARVFKIARDDRGSRLTYLKVTGGSLKVKMPLSGRDRQGKPWQEKADQLRLYSGSRYQGISEATGGMICAVTGLTSTYSGEGLGAEGEAPSPLLRPVMGCDVLLPEGTEPHGALLKLQQLSEEDPSLHILWNERARRIRLQMMGQVQLDVLRRKIRERFDMEVEFAAGEVLYRETIQAPVVGIGHFEPLRHYAEVHILIEPLPRGSGVELDTLCSEDVLDRNWQRLILTHLGEREHAGVLTGSPLTDVRLTLVAGRAHEKHTEGGDFREATYRAVRQGLMEAESVLLEPWYSFAAELPVDAVGRCMADIQRFGGETEPPETKGERVLLRGRAPVSAMEGYPLEILEYTHGLGRMTCVPDGYEPAAEQAAVVERLGYDPERDTDNPADSVFCSHGAGRTIPWREVPEAAHIQTDILKQEERSQTPVAAAPPRRGGYGGTKEEDEELQRIFERTYGEGKRRPTQPPVIRPPQVYTPKPMGEEYLLVDGYNIIFAWDPLKKLAERSLDDARKALADILCNYQGYKKCRLILVYDAYRVKGNPGEVEKYRNIHIVYTKEAETADMYIEKATYRLGAGRRVRVATSDGLEQLIILGHGAVRISAEAFRQEVEDVNARIREIVEDNNRIPAAKAAPIVRRRRST